MEEQKARRIVGDGQKIILRTNSDSLLVIGSGNSVQVENNEGTITIVGDGCRISVERGDGRIEYNGDGGYLETGSNLRNIKYKGDGGRIVQLNSGKEVYKSNRREQNTIKQNRDKNNTKCVNVINKNNYHVSTNTSTVLIPEISVPAMKTAYVTNKKL